MEFGMASEGISSGVPQTNRERQEKSSPTDQCILTTLFLAALRPKFGLGIHRR
jgi:hypothetical protein